jgi:hypothetical protein
MPNNWHQGKRLVSTKAAVQSADIWLIDRLHSAKESLVAGN